MDGVWGGRGVFFLSFLSLFSVRLNLFFFHRCKQRKEQCNGACLFSAGFVCRERVGG